MKSTDPKPRRQLAGSKDARKSAALILETLGGLRTTQEASDVLGIALARYYVLEKRALEGMIAALEPRPRGRKRSLEIEIERARDEIARLERELLRYQSLHRLSQRVVGVPPEDTPPRRDPKKKKTVRRRRKQARGERVLEHFGRESSAKAAPAAPSSTDASASLGKGGSR